MKPEIIDITGIGPTAAAALGEHGIKSVADLARSSVEEITAVPGFSEARAVKVIADATELLGTPATIPADSGNGKSPEKADKTSSKDKKDKKKGKGKDKNKKKGKGKGKNKGKK